MLWSTLSTYEKQRLVLNLQQRRSVLLLSRHPRSQVQGKTRKSTTVLFKSPELEAAFHKMPKEIQEMLLKGKTAAHGPIQGPK